MFPDANILISSILTVTWGTWIYLELCNYHYEMLVNIQLLRMNYSAMCRLEGGNTAPICCSIVQSNRKSTWKYPHITQMKKGCPPRMLIQFSTGYTNLPSWPVATELQLPMEIFFMRTYHDRAYIIRNLNPLVGQGIICNSKGNYRSSSRISPLSFECYQNIICSGQIHLLSKWVRHTHPWMWLIWDVTPIRTQQNLLFLLTPDLRILLWRSILFSKNNLFYTK